MMKETNVNQKKEFDELKARFETLEKTHQLIVESFASEYHEMKMSDGNGSNGACQKLSLVDIPHWPPINTQEDKPDAIYWVKGSFQWSAMGQLKWDTDGNSTTVEKKNKPGCPQKLTDEDDIPLDGSHCCTHLYLEREDGTPISVSELRALSQTACRIWVSLIDFKLAPVTWGKISSLAWEYYAQKMLNEPGLKFLWLCDDSQWKLQEWLQQSYSGWAKRHGIRQACPVKRELREDNPLDNWGLIQMDPSDNEEPDDKDTPEANTENQKALGLQGVQLTVQSPQGTNKCSGKHGATPPMLNSAGTDNSNTMPLPTPESLADTHTAARQMGSVPTGTHRTQTQVGPTSQQCRHRIHWGKYITNPPPPNLGPTTNPNPNPNAQEPNMNPTDTVLHNFRFKHTMAALGKKRKPDDKTGPSASSKKQKLSMAMLATPSDTNSIKWNEQQPRGQGLADDFDIYFKTLTEADKESFKKEMCAVQAANLCQEESEGCLEIHCKYKDN
ncbi:hypothetical protein EI94DRAFT_1700712 [Lactarius quietus]|nr:hypothetical protein EI94DRAFT_1700712 [Lactarius quietus]